MSRTSFLKSYLYSVNCLPSSSSSSGFDGRVADADVVDRLDDADAEEVGPDEVGEVRGEVRVLRRGEPVGQHHAAVLAGHVGRVAAEELRRHRPAADRVRAPRRRRS